MAVIWMALVLKIPIAALLWLVWWAVRQEPEPVGADEDDGGSKQGAEGHTSSLYVRWLEKSRAGA